VELEAIKQALNLEKAVEGADLVINRFKLQTDLSAVRGAPRGAPGAAVFRYPLVRHLLRALRHFLFMIRFLAADLWREVRVRAKKALRRRAVIAYVTDPEPLNLRTGDVLVTDATHHAISSGQTKAKSLAPYFNLFWRYCQTKTTSGRYSQMSG